MEPSATTLDIDVPDDSILAHKELTIRPISQMKLKHLRAFQRVVAAGRNANMDDLAAALEGALIGWTPDDIEELTLDDMLLVIGKLGAQQQAAIPNGSGSPSSTRSPRTPRGRARTGSKP